MKKLILILAIIGVIFISGCVGHLSSGQIQAKSTCGNGVVESLEECDGTTCAGAKICNEECKCVSLSPPALPD